MSQRSVWGADSADLRGIWHHKQGKKPQLLLLAKELEKLSGVCYFEVYGRDPVHQQRPRRPVSASTPGSGSLWL